MIKRLFQLIKYFSRHRSSFYTLDKKEEFIQLIKQLPNEELINFCVKLYKMNPNNEEFEVEE